MVGIHDLSDTYVRANVHNYAVVYMAGCTVAALYRMAPVDKSPTVRNDSTILRNLRTNYC